MQGIFAVKNTINEKESLLKERRRIGLFKLLHYALTDIRAYAWEGKCQEAAELADIFHNIPIEIWEEGVWDIKILFEELEEYQKKYGGRNYLSHLNRIF